MFEVAKSNRAGEGFARQKVTSVPRRPRVADRGKRRIGIAVDEAHCILRSVPEILSLRRREGIEHGDADAGRPPETL